MKLRRNEMKLRKYAISSPKNFPTPHWIIKISTEEFAISFIEAQMNSPYIVVQSLI